MQKVNELQRYCTEYKLEQILRELNKNANALARMASMTDFELSQLILVELLNKGNTIIMEQVLAI